jgi:hypothetical protein
MFARFMLSGVFFALLAAPALAVQVIVVTPNPDSVFIGSIGSDGFGYANYPGPTFQLNDDKGKPIAGQTLTFYCTGAAFSCPAMLSKTAKTDQFGHASLQFKATFKAAIPPAPPGRGFIVGTYLMAANPEGCAAYPGTNCLWSRSVTVNVLCNGPFTQCVGVPATPSPAPTTAPAPKTSAPASTSKATLGVTDTANPIPVALTKSCKGASCDYSFAAFVHVKLLDANGKPVKGAQVNIDFGNLAGSPWSVGTTANTDANGAATLETDFMYNSKVKPPPLDAGSKITGHMTVSGAAYSSLKLDVIFALH